MNKLINGLIILGVLFALPGCKKDSSDGPSETAVQLSKLVNTWTLTSVSLDDLPKTGYENLTLVLSGEASAETYSYVVSSRPDLSPWPAEGTWQFGENISTQVIRDGDTTEELAITYSLVDNALTIEFDYSGDGYEVGRTENVSGHWIFKFEI